MGKKQKSWQAPAFTDAGSERMGWVEEALIQEGESWLKGQCAYSDIPKSLAIISGKIAEDANQKRSNLNINHAKYDLRKIVGTLADVREVGQYTSDSKSYLPQAALFNKVVRAVVLEAHWSRRLRMALQYMGATAKGYIWPKAERMNGEEIRINFEPLGLLDVLPIQLPQDNDLQKAYAVTLIVFMPVYLAHGKFPWAQETLKPIARRRYLSTVSARRLDLAERFKYGESAGENWANLYCEIRYSFIRDLSINQYDNLEIPMGEFKDGEPQTSWSYKVPYLGQEIPSHVGSSGQRQTKTADHEDCMIYPYRRLMITSKGMNLPLYDGPAKDWHGMLPLAEYCADDWPWEPSGYSLIRDIFSVERARQMAERGVDQTVKARLDPSLGYDRSMGLNDVTAQTLDPYEERGRVGVDGEVRKVIDTMLPQFLLEIPAQVAEWLKYLSDAEDHSLGLNEIQNLAEFKATLQSDQSIDKALSLVGPLVKDISSGMEHSTTIVWDLLKYMIPQYYNTKRIMQYVGPDNVTPETYDYDPDSLIPSHGPDEFANLAPDQVIPGKSVYDKIQRARLFAKNLRLIVVPHTMHEITQTQEQLKWLQLYRGGFPLAPHDVAKKLNIENYGEINGATYFERYVAYKELEIALAARLAKITQAMGVDMGLGGGPANGKGSQHVTGGRPPSGKQSPKVKEKSGGPLGPRTVISESG